MISNRIVIETKNRKIGSIYYNHTLWNSDRFSRVGGKTGADAFVRPGSFVFRVIHIQKHAQERHDGRVGVDDVFIQECVAIEIVFGRLILLFV